MNNANFSGQAEGNNSGYYPIMKQQVKTQLVNLEILEETPVTLYLTQLLTELV